MIFNSFEFFVFFIAFFFLYWFAFKSVKSQNIFLLLASYVFYGWWDWRFLALLIGTSALNFYLGIYIQKTVEPKKRKWLLYTGLLLGIGSLLFFKYFNFFITSFNDVLSSLHIKAGAQTLNIILPLGISFYTFRMLSYLLDIDKGKMRATGDWVVFLGYVSFFPSVMSGPIDKARSFIPQLEKKRVFDSVKAADGLRQILWGLFKKIVIADNCSTISSGIFDNYQTLKGSSLLLGAFFYAIELYSDFSGYSDMAIGISRLMGFNVSKNFDFPFFAKNIAEFWRKWHISLTSWMTEYVFTPLSFYFRDYGKGGLILAILINLTIIGIWHGANWTFVLYGLMHGCYFIPMILRGTLNNNKLTAKNKLFPTFREGINILATFLLVVVTLIVFRSESVSQAFHYYHRLLSTSLFTIAPIPKKAAGTLAFLSVMLLVEWLQRNKEHGLQIDNIRNSYIRFAIYYSILFSVILYSGTRQQFIYFQF